MRELSSKRESMHTKTDAYSGSVTDRIVTMFARPTTAFRNVSVPA